MMEAAVSRLEAVTQRLEAFEARLSSLAPSARTVPPAPVETAAPTRAVAGGQAAAPATSASGGGADTLAAYRMLLAGQLVRVVDAAELVGGQVLAATRLLAAGFEKEAVVVEAMGACRKPSDAELQALVGPVGEQMVAAGDLASGPRSPYQHHFKFVSEAMQALSWVAYTGPNCGIRLPAQHVEDSAAAADFYANKVLMEWRSKDPNHVAWVQALKELLAELKVFCARHFPAGPAWNPSGIPASDFKPGAGPAAAKPAAASSPPPKAPGGPPPPPPPPPPGALLSERKPGAAATGSGSSGGGGNPMAALFADINKGTAVTSGLRKVTDDMKAKNRGDRSGAVPAGPASGAPSATPGSGAAAQIKTVGPPRLECEQGRKWVVENQVGNRDIVIDQTEPKQTVYIFNCSSSTIQVRGKVNAITMDKCTRTGLLFDQVVATCELVNCAGVEVQCTGAVPTVAVDKSDGCQLYLPRASLGGTDITTAKSSEVNVVVPGPAEDAELVESAIPEQFVTRHRGGRWVTEPVAHSAA